MPEVQIPEVGEIVIGRIVKVLDYGVFLELLEYEGVQGFVHISNVSSSWIKNIRNFVKEGQVRAGKVTNIDRQRGQIDISLTKVSATQQREKIEEFRQAKRSQKLIELLAGQIKEAPEVAMKEVAEPLLQHYDSLYDAFLAILADESLLSLVPKKWASHLKEIVSKNYELPRKTVRGQITISIPGPEGVEHLRKALQAGQKKGGKSAEVFYDGSGKYDLRVTSSDYKSAEKLLKSVSDEIASQASSSGGKAEFVRIEG
ncbi:Translation initiation factor 2 subunit alpha [uncultured archaeon]|nr:Translation initiation factor 2 subunit alpha [uncultured archaeon]